MPHAEIVAAVRDLRGCVGLSVWRLDEGVLSTDLALDGEDSPADGTAAVLDAVQYLDGGPGTDAVREGDVVDATATATMQHRWPLFAAVAADLGVRGAIAVPIRLDLLVPVAGERRRGLSVAGAVTVYFSAPTAVDPALVSLAESAGVISLLREPVGTPPQPAPADTTMTDLDSRTTQLVETALRLPDGTGDQCVRSAAKRAQVAVTHLGEVLARTLT